MNSINECPAARRKHRRGGSSKRRRRGSSKHQDPSSREAPSSNLQPAACVRAAVSMILSRHDFVTTDFKDNTDIISVNRVLMILPSHDPAGRCLGASGSLCLSRLCGSGPRGSSLCGRGKRGNSCPPGVMGDGGSPGGQECPRSRFAVLAFCIASTYVLIRYSMLDARCSIARAGKPASPADRNVCPTKPFRIQQRASSIEHPHTTHPTIQGRPNCAAPSSGGLESPPHRQTGMSALPSRPASSNKSNNPIQSIRGVSL
jgi:hypothetical protein